MQNWRFNWKFIGRITGAILVFESLFMFISAGIATYFQGTDARSFVASAFITLICGACIILPTGFERIKIIGKRESYLAVTLSWLLFALFGALPFFLSGEVPSFTNAFFESTSGITTTGASILTNIDSMSKGLLFWRSLMQWLGGMGIIVFSLALLPILGGEASLLFDAEASGLTHDRFRPRVAEMAKRLWAIYLGFTVILIVLLLLGPMGKFDALCHSFTTVSTGGFSTKQLSITYWHSYYTEVVLVIFMISGAINFTLFYFLITGKGKRLIRDEELHWFLWIIVILSVLVGIGLIIARNYDVFTAFRISFFQIISIITTTGFITDDFFAWGSAFLIPFMLAMIVCGCVGSTSGGLKVVRAVVLVKNTFCELKRMMHPRAIIPVRLNGSAVPFNVVQRLLAFAFLYVMIIFISWGVLLLAGAPFVDSLGAVISSLGNVGPGFGTLGGYGSYVDLPVFVKWYLSFLMIVGRLEIFTVLILFTPGFWKR